MSRLVRAGLLALALILAAAALVVAGFLADSHSHHGRVARRVTLAGRLIGGLTPAQLRPVVVERAARFDEGTVKVEAPGGGFTTTAKRLGARLDIETTTKAALDAGKDGTVFRRLFWWLGSWFHTPYAPVKISLDEVAVRRAVLTLDKGPRQAPVEPSVIYKKGAFTTVAGKDGKGIDPQRVIDALPAAAEHGLPVTLDVDRGEVPPRYSELEARKLAGRAQALVSHSVNVTASGASATVPISTLRTWVTTKASSNGLALTLDPDKAATGLEKLLAGAGDPPVETTFTLDGNGNVVVVPGKAGTSCCSAGAVALVDQAVFGKRRQPVDLPLRSKDPELTAAEAAGLGVKEPVGSFTTRHAAGQPRVTNIHRIADLVRGHVIEPGQTFSVNTFIGPRTLAKGFVVDHVIEDGRFSEAVGGGISQFATTLFNASFFAGLDLVEYQSHSIYISRYPYGREATLNYPKPDLVIRNSTPYGVMIWTSYTGTSITVTIYSTHFVDSAQTGQTKEPRGVCTRVITERTRTYLSDGHKTVDHVSALYRPAEGLDCAGQPTPTVSTTSSSTTTTRPPAATTAPPTTAKPG